MSYLSAGTLVHGIYITIGKVDTDEYEVRYNSDGIGGLTIIVTDRRTKQVVSLDSLPFNAKQLIEDERQKALELLRQGKAFWASRQSERGNSFTPEHNRGPVLELGM